MNTVSPVKLTRWSGSKLNTVECRPRLVVVFPRRFENFCGMSVKQDMQVRTMDVVRSNVCSGRAATRSIANGALDPPNANLFVHETSQPKMISSQAQNHKPYGVSSIHVPLEWKLGGKFVGCCEDPRIDNL
jgi:hypothetical protein